VIRPAGTFSVAAQPAIVKNFHIESPPTAQLAGLVLAGARDVAGRPVAGAIIEGRAYGTGSGRSDFQALADAHGRFTVERDRGPTIILARSPNDEMAGFAFIPADGDQAVISLGPAATIRGRMTYPDARPFAETRIYCRIVLEPPARVVDGGLPPAIVRYIQTDSDGRFQFAGVPVGARCSLLGRTRIGDVDHRASAEIAVNQAGPILVPELVLKPPSERRRPNN
jgi:hypothetical protein